MTNQLITIFGGTGFLGRAISYHLTKAGATVRIAARHPYIPDRVKTSSQIELQAADIRDEASVTKAINGATSVVNAVGLYVEQGKATFEAIHVAGAERVARQARKAGI